MKLSTILWIIFFAVMIFIIILLLGYLQIEPFTIVYTTVMGYAGNINLEEAASNPMTLVTGAATGIGTAASVGGLAYSKLNSAKTQFTSLKTSAETQIGNLTSKLDNADTTINDLQTKLKTSETTIQQLTKDNQVANDLKTQLSTVQSNFSKLELEKTSIKTQLDDMKSQFNNLQIRYDELRKLNAVK